MKRLYGIGAVLFIVICYLIVGTMEVEQEMDKQRMSIEATQAQMQYNQAQLDKLREQMTRADEQLAAFNLLIWEMRERLHLDLELDLREAEE